MTVTREALDRFYNSLAEKRANNRLNETGLELLEAIEDGSIAPAQVGLLLQGVSWNTGDEASGYVRSLLPRLKDREILENVQRDAASFAQSRGQPAPEISQRDLAIELERRPIREFRDENPLAAAGLETAGAFLSGGPLGASRSTAKNIALGTLSGGVSGFASGEGDAVDRLDDAAVGAAAGGTLTGFTDLLKGPFATLYNAVFRSGKRYKTRQGRKLAQRKLIEAIESEGLTVDEAIQKVLALEGKQYSLADLNDNTQALVDAVAILPGPSKTEAMQFLRNRAKGRTERITGFLQEAFGQRASFYTDFQAMKEARSTVADKLYGGANRILIPVNDELRSLMTRPAMRNAYRKAMTIASNKGKVSDINFRLTSEGNIVDGKGNQVSEIPTLFLHYMKMGIDDVAFPKMPKQGIGAAEVGGIRDLRTEFLNFIDQANPQYARARKIYAGDTAVLNAMKEGREILRTKDIDELADRIRQMNPSEREAFRLGALQNFQDQIDTSRELGNVAYQMINTPRRKQLLRMSFPNTEKGQAEFDVFFDNLNRESVMSSTEKAAGNSLTTQRGELVRQIRNDVATEIDLPTNASDIIFSKMRQNAAVGQDDALAAVTAEMARILTETDPQKLKKIAAQLGGGGDVVTVIQANAPEFLPQILPLLGTAATTPATLGNIGGGFAADIYQQSPQLNDMQRALIQ